MDPCVSCRVVPARPPQRSGCPFAEALSAAAPARPLLQTSISMSAPRCLSQARWLAHLWLAPPRGPAGCPALPSRRHHAVQMCTQLAPAAACCCF